MEVSTCPLGIYAEWFDSNVGKTIMCCHIESKALRQGWHGPSQSMDKSPISMELQEIHSEIYEEYVVSLSLHYLSLSHTPPHPFQEIFVFFLNHLVPLHHSPLSIPENIIPRSKYSFFRFYGRSPSGGAS